MSVLFLAVRYPGAPAVGADCTGVENGYSRRSGGKPRARSSGSRGLHSPRSSVMRLRACRAQRRCRRSKPTEKPKETHAADALPPAPPARARPVRRRRRPRRRRPRRPGRGDQERQGRDQRRGAEEHLGVAVAARRRLQGRVELPALELRLRADALLPRLADQHVERVEAQAGVHLPDRGARVDADGADRRRRRHVPDHLVQPRLRHRRGHRQGVLALQVQAGPGDDLLLRPEQPRRGDPRQPPVHGHARRQDGRARRQDRQGAVGLRDRRPRGRLLGDDGAGGRRRQGADRHQRRRVRRARLRQGLRRQERQAALDLLHHPREGPRGRVGREGRHRPPPQPRHRGREEAALREGRRLLQDARRRRLDGARGRPRDEHRLLRRRQPQPRPLRRRAPGRQPLHRLDRRRRPQHRRLQVALPVHPARRVGPGLGGPGRS